MELKYKSDMLVSKSGQLFGGELKYISSIDLYFSLVGAIEGTDQVQ